MWGCVDLIMGYIIVNNYESGLKQVKEGEKSYFCKPNRRLFFMIIIRTRATSFHVKSNTFVVSLMVE